MSLPYKKTGKATVLYTSDFKPVNRREEERKLNWVLSGTAQIYVLFLM
jgi:hypothetical protein